MIGVRSEDVNEESGITDDEDCKVVGKEKGWLKEVEKKVTDSYEDVKTLKENVNEG